ncbi:MAG: hypothetical protein ACE5HW_07495, partial [Candidatus Methanofastidiosia archaeon]
IGMWVNPHDEGYFNYRKALDLAKEGGVQVVHYYARWGYIELKKDVYDWKISDFVIDNFHKKDFEIVVVIPIIFSTVIDDLPQDLEFRNFADPLFVSRFENFLNVFLKRYVGKIHYLVIGNEVDIYFAEHRDELKDFREFLLEIFDFLKGNYSEIKIGTEFAYHSVLQKNLEYVVRELNIGDLTFFTLYISDEEFDFSGDIENVEKYFRGMMKISDGKKIAIVETSQSSSEILSSSEEKQALYVKEIFRILKENKNRIEFLMWLTLHDGKPEDCRKSAEFFVRDHPEFLENVKGMARFKEFMCFLGLRNSDGSPKLAWNEWLKQVEDYYGGIL